MLQTSTFGAVIQRRLKVRDVLHERPFHQLVFLWKHFFQGHYLFQCTFAILVNIFLYAKILFHNLIKPDNCYTTFELFLSQIFEHSSYMFPLLHFSSQICSYDSFIQIYFNVVLQYSNLIFSLSFDPPHVLIS